MPRERRDEYIFRKILDRFDMRDGRVALPGGQFVDTKRAGGSGAAEVGGGHV